MEKWTPPDQFVGIKERDCVGSGGFYKRERFRGGMRAIFKEERENEEGLLHDWEPIKAFKLRLREFEQRSSSSEIFGGLKNRRFVEKLKSSLVRYSVLNGRFFLLCLKNVIYQPEICYKHQHKLFFGCKNT